MSMGNTDWVRLLKMQALEFLGQQDTAAGSMAALQNTNSWHQSQPTRKSKFSMLILKLHSLALGKQNQNKFKQLIQVKIDLWNM